MGKQAKLVSFATNVVSPSQGSRSLVQDHSIK